MPRTIAVEEGPGFPMSAATLLIRCPVCESDGEMLRHNGRAPLLYSCQKCLHEWQLEPGAEPPQADHEPKQPDPDCSHDAIGSGDSSGGSTNSNHQ